MLCWACEKELRPPIPPNCIFEGVISSCWASDPNLRPDFDEIVIALSEIQRLVGQIENAAEFDEDPEDQQYNYSEANQIFQRTLRTLRGKSGGASTPATSNLRLEASTQPIPAHVLPPMGQPVITVSPTVPIHALPVQVTNPSWARVP